MLTAKNTAMSLELETSIKNEKLFTKAGVQALLAEKGVGGAFEYNKSEGVEVIDCSRGDAHFRSALQRVLQECIGHAQCSALNSRFPLDLLARTKNKWVGALAPYGYEYGIDEDGNHTSERSPQIEVILKLLETRLQEIENAVARQVANGNIAFDDLPFFYTKGKECFFVDDEGETVAGAVDTAGIQRTWFGSSYLSVTLDMIHAVHGELVPGKYTAVTGEYSGVRSLDELSIKPMTKEVKAKLTARGKLYVRCAVTPTYLSYAGQLTRSSWWSNETFRADGRVMIDVHSFKRVDNDQFSQEARKTGIAGMREGDAGTKVPGFSPSEADLWKTYPYVYGFSFRAKRWGKMAMTGLSEIAWRSDAFDKLVLPEDEKKLVRALVEHNDGSFEDLIEGKGGGCIFLLHGPPGQGKTLTAETIAELLKRPLYAISVGELGVTPDELEERLRVILDVATVWNAVILLDEADIYLEARDERDIVRNAMVGVFLRLLEYHHGVLFLTTNRVKNIDPAFYSRISVALHFAKGANDKREKIWENLLESASIKGIDAKELAVIDINGRQIKNAIRLSQTLAKSEKKEVDVTTLKRVIELMTAFDRERSEAGSI